MFWFLRFNRQIDCDLEPTFLLSVTFRETQWPRALQVHVRHNARHPDPPARIKAERREDSVAQVLTTNPVTNGARQTPSVQEARDVCRVLRINSMFLDLILQYTCTQLARTYGVLAKAKKDKGFDDDAVEELLRNIGNDPYPVTLDAAIRYLQVSRKFMSTFFGCHNQKMFVTEKVKGRHICFLNIVEGHPNGPRIPGFNGLLFMQEPHDGDHSLNGAEFIVFSHLGKHRWLQQGIYRATLAPPLSQARWVLQNQNVSHLMTPTARLRLISVSAEDVVGERHQTHELGT